jgi:hypothetical protein
MVRHANDIENDGTVELEEGPTGNRAQDAESSRRDERDSVLVFANIRPEDGSTDPIAARVRNVSSGGLMAQAPEQYRTGLRIEIDLEGIGPVKGVVAWSEAGRIGIAFDHPIDKSLARNPGPGADETLFRPNKGDYKRPPLKPR